MSDTEDTPFYLIPGRNHRIHIVTEEQMDRLLEGIMDSSLADEDRMDSYTDIGSKIQMVTLDKQGRFPISQTLAEYAGIGDKVVFLGSMVFGTILPQESWANRTSPKDSSLDMIQKIQEEAFSKNRKSRGDGV